MILAAGTTEIAPLFVELGLIFGVLALSARLALRLGLSPIPFFLLTGLIFGEQGIMPVQYTFTFIQIVAEIGVILLLFMLGLQYNGDELKSSLRSGVYPGFVNIVLNFAPGVICGLMLGWDFPVALLLGGVTYASSSGIISKLLNDLGWLGNRETPVLLSLLVFEDLVMAVYLPLMTVLLVGAGLVTGLLSLASALLTIFIIASVSIRYGDRITRIIATHSNEIILLTVVAITLLVGGMAQEMDVSAAVGAFLFGIALSGTVREQVQVVITPLKDLFAAVFFVFFGLQINPMELPPVLMIALALGVVSGITKLITGIWASRRQGISSRGQARAGVMLMIRGEFSIVIAGLAATAGVNEPQLAPLTAAYVLLMAIIGPIIIRFLTPIMNVLQRKKRTEQPVSVPVPVRE